MKGILAVLALLVFVFAVPAVAQEKPGSTGPDDNFPKGWHEAPLVERVAYLTDGVQLNLNVLLDLRKKFSEIKSSYPFKDDGISVQISGKRGENGTIRVGVLVNAVWTDSPGDKAGILPGDWILTVNGTPVCGKSSLLVFEEKDLQDKAKVDAAQAAAKSCLENAINLTHNAEGESYAQEVDRDGKTLVFKTGRAVIGDRVAEFLSRRMPEWEATWTTAEADLKKLVADLATGGEDEKKVDALFLRFQAIDDSINEPQRQFNAFLATQQKTLAPK